MGLIDLQYQEGQTPLDEEEKEALLIPSVTTRGELDEVEQRNIEEAVRWTIERRRKFTADEILSEKFVKELTKPAHDQFLLPSTVTFAQSPPEVLPAQSPIFPESRSSN